MENLLFTVMGVLLGWIPSAYFWVRDKFTSTGAPGITFVVRPHVRPADAKFQCKILVDITNRRSGPVRIAAAYFVFNKGAPLRPDPKWSGEYRTERFLLPFFSLKTGTHELPDVYLRPGETTNIWIAVDPEHANKDIEQAREGKNIGRLYFQMTRWTGSGSSKTRWVYRKL
ncbi:MAG: hypothetical protein DME69_00365 [Verrucomicrobia bacterium]|nr:MAG: hypothetical protein DME69_00365 [Verrucomicrobiota bacterium]